MSQKTIEEHKKIISDAIENNNLAIFVGSGVSYCTNPKYPLWQDICDKLKKELHTEENDFLKIAQLYQLEFNKEETKKKVRSFFPKVDKPGKIQRKILELNAHYIITTNWDKLIDNEINENAEIYDIVVNDEELTKSTNNCKYIKMHGDFDHNNYVFTEDDYLNYSNKFPLIENFLKSIISTHVVLIIGYSFSDIDLKQIINWIQNNSTVSLPIYMIKIDNNIQKTEIKYLKKFRITVIPLHTKKNSMEDEILLAFLDDLVKIKNNGITTTAESYVYNLLKPLKEYPVLVRKQVQTQLSNCGFEFDQYSRALLKFYHTTKTNDYDAEKRKIFTDFVSSLPPNKKRCSKTLKRIISILKKADIHGIMCNDKDEESRYYFSFDNKNKNTTNYQVNSKVYDFDFSVNTKKTQTINKLLENVVAYDALGEFEKAFINNKQCLQICKKNKKYIQIFICMFNYNYLLKRIKNGLFIPPKKNEYKDYFPIDIDFQFSKLPQKTKKLVKCLFDVINFNILYEEIFFVVNSLNKIQSAVNVIKKGGAVFSSDSFKYKANHKNIIDYVIKNKLLLEKHSEFITICKNYLLISLNRQSVNTKVSLNKYELITCIKYFSNKELQETFYSFGEMSKWQALDLDEERQYWLIKIVLFNCIKYYPISLNLESSIENYINNTLFILSLVKINKRKQNIILNDIKEFLLNNKCTISFFSSINSFFGNQYHYNKKHTINSQKIFNIINILLNKFINSEYNGYEYYVLSQNQIYNLFGYISTIKDKYKDEKTLKMFLEHIDTLKTSEAIVFYTNLLPSLHQIADDKCKNILKNYYISKEFSDLKENNESIKYYIYKIIIQILNIKKLPLTFISELSSFIKKYPTNTFNELFYSLQIYLNIVIKSDDRFNNLKVLLDSFIEKKRKEIVFPSQL